MKNKKIIVLYLLIIVALFTSCSVPKTPKDLYSDDIKSIYLETTYGLLQFPEKWETFVDNEIINEGNVETVQYWASVGEHEKVHIFDVAFGGEGYYVGTIKNNINTDVFVVSYDIQLDDTWTEEESNILYSIADDVNYLLIKLEDIEGFEPVG